MSFNYVGLPKYLTKPGKQHRPSLPLSRVELHIHLDGAVRPDTLWDVSHGTGMVPPCKSLQDLKVTGEILLVRRIDLVYNASPLVFTTGQLGYRRAEKPGPLSEPVRDDHASHGRSTGRDRASG